MAKKQTEQPVTDATDEQNEQSVKKERKQRETKVKHAAGSPHAVLTTFINELTPTQADYFHRHIVKKALKEEHAEPGSFEGELFNGIRAKLV